MDSETFLTRWMFFNCPKDFSWIIYNNISDITKNSEYQLKTEDLIYVHAVYITQKELISLIETSNGFYFIHNLNQTDQQEVSTSVVKFDSLEKSLDGMTKTEKNLMGIKKSSLRKMTQEQKKRDVFPWDYLQTDDVSSLLSRELNVETGVLDLSYNFNVTSEHLFQWESKYFVRTLNLHTCCQIKDFKWLSANWIKDIETVNFINMSQITNRNMEFVVHKMEGLKELGIHLCPQVNIRVILGTLKLNRLERLHLNDVNMNCQPNQYSGLIKEEEWELFRNRSCQRLLINSKKISLDIIDYLAKSCLALNDLIIDHEKYKYFKENLLNDHDPNCEDGINIISTEQVKIRVPRDFKVKNLLKHRYSKPFSDSMLKVMEQAFAEDELERESDSSSASKVVCAE